MYVDVSRVTSNKIVPLTTCTNTFVNNCLFKRAEVTSICTNVKIEIKIKIHRTVTV